MKTYLEIKVPIHYDDSWFVQLRSVMGSIPVKWQKQYYHITMAFIDDTITELVTVSKVIEGQINNFLAPSITFDKIDTFITSSGNMYIINLTTDTAPASFVDRISNIRNKLIEGGNKIDSNFRLHVTLGRINDISIPLSRIQNITNQFKLQPFTIRLKDVEYRIFHGHSLNKWILEKEL